MSQLDAILTANEDYSRNFKHGSLPLPPSRKIAIVACMDARLTVEDALGLETGQAHIIRNAGGVVTDDALRSLIISHELLGTREFIVINHTDCGMVTFKDDELRNRLDQKYKSDPAGLKFYSFSSAEDNVKDQVAKIKSSPFLSGDVAVTGFVYDVRTGKLGKVAR